MAYHGTIIHSGLDSARAHFPAAVVTAMASHAAASLNAGKFSIATVALSVGDMDTAVRSMPWGHERLSLNENLILLDAGALIAYAPYRARVVLTGDPFAEAESLAAALELDPGALRTRLHDGLIGAERVIAFSAPAFEAVAPFLKRPPERLTLPPFALKSPVNGSGPVLVVGNEKPEAAAEMLSTLRAALPDQSFEAFDPGSVLETRWKAVVHLGVASSDLPGARLSDAWAGGVPILQLLDRHLVDGLVRRQARSPDETVVQHGKNGLQLFSLDELTAALRDFTLDPLPLRSVAHGARRSIDPPAHWDYLLKTVLE